MKKGVVITGVVAVAAIAALIVPRVLKPKAVVEEAAVPVVDLVTPETGNIELSRGIIGNVEPADVLYVYPKTSGEVTDVLVKVGDTVTEGQELLKIDVKKQLDAAKLTLDGAEVTMNDANTNPSRMQALFAAGDISSQALEQAQSAAKGAKIQYDGAKLSYDNQLEFGTVTSSISGKIESLNVEVHDNVAPQSLICVISGEGSKAVTFSVPEKIVNNLSMGDAVRIEKNGSEYHGTITEINSMIDAATGLFKIKASVEDGDTLPTGSTTKLYVVSDKAENVMTIPVDCIYYEGGDGFVYTYDNGTVHKIPVEVGIYDAENAEILSGIKMSDKVISTWSSELFEGSKVMDAQQAGAVTDAAADETTAETKAN